MPSNYQDQVLIKLDEIEVLLSRLESDLHRLIDAEVTKSGSSPESWLHSHPDDQ